MSGIARVTDQCSGICTGHIPPIPMTGQITTGEADVTGNFLNVATTGSIVTGLCGHTGIVQATSTNISINGKAIARQGDPFTGVFSGTITTSSPDITG